MNKRLLIITLILCSMMIASCNSAKQETSSNIIRNLNPTEEDDNPCLVLYELK